MKPIEKIALDSLLWGIIDFQVKLDEFILKDIKKFSDEYELNDDFGAQDCADKLITAAIEKVAEKLELSGAEIYDALDALQNELQTKED